MFGLPEGITWCSSWKFPVPKISELPLPNTEGPRRRPDGRHGFVCEQRVRRSFSSGIPDSIYGKSPWIICKCFFLFLPCSICQENDPQDPKGKIRRNHGPTRPQVPKCGEPWPAAWRCGRTAAAAPGTSWKGWCLSHVYPMFIPQDGAPR